MAEAVTTTAVPATGLDQCAVVFEPDDPARTGRLAFWQPDGTDLPDLPGERAEAALVTAAADGTVETRTVPVLRLPVADALPVLARAAGPGARVHPAAAFWGAAAVLALHLAARRRLLPGVSAAGYDAWRAGPLDLDDVRRIRALAAAAPPEARALPLPGRGAPRLPDAEGLVRAFLDAVADTLPRTPAAEAASGRAAFSAGPPQHVPQLRAWAEEVSAGLDTGVRLSLRLELDAGPGPDPHVEPDTEPGPEPDEGPGPEPALRLVPWVHSLADPTLAAPARDVFDGGGAGFGFRATTDTAQAVRRAAGVWAPLERMLPVPGPLALTDGEVDELLGDGAGRLRAHGIDLAWPEGASRALAAEAVVGAGLTPPTDMRSLFGGESTVDFRWRLTLDGDPLTEEETRRVADAGRPVVRLRGRWLLVPAHLARKAREPELPPLTPIQALGAALTGRAETGRDEVAVAPTDWLLALRDRLADPEGGNEPLRVPETLNATLRDYQLRGVRWLERMTSLGLGGCLADDMGLGKTVQLITLHLFRQEHAETRGPTLVVCPASLLGNWEREVGRFAPGTPVRRFHGSGRTLDGADGGFVLTTYGTMRLDAERLGAHPWGMVVADEAQHVKNPLSGTAKALRLIPSDARIALTGTPVENNLSELWAVLDWTTPGLLGTHGRFRSRWAKPVEAERSTTGGTEEPGAAGAPEGGGTAARLAELVRPFLLRRRKTDPGIAPELPPKTETDRPVPLTREQTALYEALVRDVMAEIGGSDGIARRGLVLKLLTGLKQICNHPAQFLKEEDAAKAAGDPLRLSGRSGKLELLDELLDTILAEDGAVLVFTQYVAMARLLERHLADRGVPAQLLHGGTPVPRREELVRRFQNGEVPVFLLSLKAAGTGLNLTRADHVVHYDRWWNPAVEAQATDRAYRIGQTRPVQVHRMIAEGTVEDRIAAMLQAKKELADAVLGAGEAALTELTNDELANLVELRSAG
ncbi:SNF2-related protein [Streptomyces sp. bgisy126]|uniref:DEAD/DEAH box helicase n=1 Tax=unclassified Streptomyces TaxID=2593676 RepID=UPI003EB6D57B